jgi:hypothetical protein
MDVQHIIDFLFGLLVAIMGFFMKNLHAKTEKNTEELSRFKEYVALNHPVNDSIDRRFDKIESKIDKILDKMDK